MQNLFKMKLFLTGLLILVLMQASHAGPPFNTDDPEPVGFRHWEYYLSTINTFTAGVWSGTSPHVEANYGLVRNVQVHLLLPMNYTYSSREGSSFGYADTEVGAKFRFISETDSRPQVGTFPIIEIPTVSNNEYSSGKTKIFIPVWLQKSWEKITTYGGAGYWFNPGDSNRNWLFAGWEIQYDFSDAVTLGGELFYNSSSTVNGSSMAAFNLGGSVNPSERFHIIFSLGHSIAGGSSFSSYFGLLWTV
jgi:hypothetical protein